MAPRPPRPLTRIEALRLALPLMAAGALTPLLAIFDTWVIRVQPDAHVLGGVGVGTMLFNYSYWAFGFIRFSTTGMTAQAVGAADPSEIKRVLVRAGVLSGLAGLVIVIAVVAGIDHVAGRFASSPEAARTASIYVLVRIISVPAAFLNYALLGWFVAQGHVGLTMRAELLRAVTTIVAGLLLVRGFGVGVGGVAAASALAEVVAFGYSLLNARRIWPAIGGAWTWAEVFAWRAWRRVLGVSRDLAIRTQCLLMAFLGFTAGGAAYGDTVLAANALLLNLYLLIAYSLGAFSQVTSAYVGYAVGAGNAAALGVAIRIPAQVSLATAGLAGVLVLSGGSSYVELVTANAGVQAAAAAFVPFAAALPLIAVMSFQLDGVAVGATRTVLLRNSLLVALACFVVAYLVLPDAFGNAGLWASFCVFMGARSAAYWVAVPRLQRAMTSRAA